MDATTPVRSAAPAKRRPWYTILYVQVLIAIAIGVALGHYFPPTAVAMKPLGDGFIALIRMMIAPVIFCTVVHGIASMSDLKKIGRIGLKTLVYFEVVSTFALGIGLLVGELVHPGSGSTSIPPRSIPRRCRATSRGPTRTASSLISWRSSPIHFSARLPAATSCRFS